MMTKSLFQCKCFQRWLIGVYLLVSTPTQGCDNLLGLDDCIDPDIYKDRWKMINEEKCGTEQDNVMHCQKLQIGNICSVCATRKMCPAGTYAHIETLTKSVSCERCTQGWYQREPKASYHFKTPSCDSKQTDCKDRRIVCLIGSAVEDNKCQCDHRAGYRPTEEGCRCFDFNSLCECTIAQCPGGAKIDSNYNCIPVSTVRTETNMTTTSPAVIENVVGKESGECSTGCIVGIITGVLVLVLIPVVTIIYWKKCYKKTQQSTKNTGLFPITESGISGKDSTLIKPSKEITFHSSEGTESTLLVRSNGIQHSFEESEMQTPIVTQISSDDTPEMALNTPNGDLVREKALHVVREENLKYQLASKPTNLTQTINASKVNMVYGDHGCIRQEMIPFERRESSDMSSLEADGGDERQNHPMLSSDDEQEPRNSLFVNVDQAGTSQRPGDQGGTNQRPGDRGGTSQRPGDRAGTNQIELDGQSSIDRRENENQPIISFVENGNGETVDKEQTLVKLV